MWGYTYKDRIACDRPLDKVVGRFISAELFIGVGVGVLGNILLYIYLPQVAQSAQREELS